MNTHAEKSYSRLFWSLAILGLVVDQASKYGVFAELDRGQPTNRVSIVSGVFELRTHYSTERETGEGLLAYLRSLNSETLPVVNIGALFGWGTNWGWDANVLFALVSVTAAVAIILWSMRRSSRSDFFLSLSLGLILAGTLGNFYDRLVFGGVRDFLHWYYVVDWPDFNFADCCLVCGAGALLVQSFMVEPHAVEQPTSTQTLDMVEAK